MSEIKRCTECKTIKSAKFRQLKGNKWKESENNNLVKVTWTEGVVLCNICLIFHALFVDIRYVKVILIIFRDMVKRRVRKRVILQPSQKPTL